MQSISRLATLKMARYTGPKFRKDKRVGANLALKGKRSVNKHPLDKKGLIKPGVHGPKMSNRKTSDYGIQLTEKQKLRFMYGILERQFRKYFEKASTMKEETGQALMRILEARLDNLVYRAGLASSRGQARQLVNHGHVQVNGQKVDIPSYQVRVGDKINMKPKAQSFGVVLESLKDRDNSLPDWLKKKGNEYELVRLPDREELDTTINDLLIIEYYSR